MPLREEALGRGAGTTKGGSHRLFSQGLHHAGPVPPSQEQETCGTPRQTQPQESGMGWGGSGTWAHGLGRAVETGPAAAFLGRDRCPRALECGPGAWAGWGSHDQSWARTVRTLGGFQILRVQSCDLLLQVTLLLTVNLHQLTIGGENEAWNQW